MAAPAWRRRCACGVCCGDDLMKEARGRRRRSTMRSYGLPFTDVACVLWWSGVSGDGLMKEARGQSTTRNEPKVQRGMSRAQGLLAPGYSSSAASATEVACPGRASCNLKSLENNSELLRGALPHIMPPQPLNDIVAGGPAGSSCRRVGGRPVGESGGR